MVGAVGAIVLIVGELVECVVVAEGCCGQVVLGCVVSVVAVLEGTVVKYC